MVTFLIMFLSVYTGMHVFVFLRTRVLFQDRWLIQAASLVFLVLMVLGPIGVRLWEKSGHEALARLSAYIVYPWMGIVFLAFWAFLALWVLELLSKLLGGFAGIHLPSLAGKGVTLAVMGMVAAVGAYGLFEASRIGVERVRLQTVKLPEGVHRVKIAQISDVHLGLLLRHERLQRIIDLISAEEPDIVVSTGDLVDGNMGKAEEINGLLKGLRPRYGKFAITGNHEYYAGLAQSVDFTKDMGFTMLRGETASAGGIINIVGVDDPTGAKPIDEAALLGSSQNGLFTLFLRHRPQVPPGTAGLFDLQLSGHTHRGQIFPFRFITRMVYPMQDGLYDLEGGSKLYTSRGTGTWGPPMRVLSPPEVTIIELSRR